MNNRRHTLFLFALVLLLSGIACGDQVVVRETEAQCGNGSIEAGEACDDGNADNADACTNSCSTAVCGDAVTRTDLLAGEEGFEACDDGNDVEHAGAEQTDDVQPEEAAKPQKRYVPKRAEPAAAAPVRRRSDSVGDPGT